jgi:hypothetical protein
MLILTIAHPPLVLMQQRALIDSTALVAFALVSIPENFVIHTLLLTFPQ